MKATVEFYPQAWVNDYPIEVDPEGETLFQVDVKHLEQYSADARKYELEPYLNLPQLPEWIREWRGPFWFDIRLDDGVVLFTEASPGVYEYDGWTARNARLAGDARGEDAWRLTNAEDEELGPFDTLDEAREYLARYETIDDWRGDVCMALRELGHGDLADEFGGVSDQEAMVYRDTREAPQQAAKVLLDEQAALA